MESFNFAVATGIEPDMAEATIVGQGMTQIEIPGVPVKASTRMMDTGYGAFAFLIEIPEAPGSTMWSEGKRIGDGGSFGIQVAFSCAHDEMKLAGCDTPAMLCDGVMRVYTSMTGLASVITSFDKKYSMLTFGYPLDFLRTLEMEPFMPDFLRIAVENHETAQDHIFSRSTTPFLMRMAGDVATNPFTGQMAALYLQAKLMETFIGFCHMMGKQATKALERVSPHDRKCAARAREILVANAMNPPSLFDLSGMVGISYKKLNRAFLDL